MILLGVDPAGCVILPCRDDLTLTKSDASAAGAEVSLKPPKRNIFPNVPQITEECRGHQKLCEKQSILQKTVKLTQLNV